MILAAKIHCSNSPAFVFVRNGHLILKVSRGNLKVFPFLYILCRSLFWFLSNIYDRTFDENYSIIGAWQCRLEYVTGMNDYMSKATNKNIGLIKATHYWKFLHHQVPRISDIAAIYFCFSLIKNRLQHSFDFKKLRLQEIVQIPTDSFTFVRFKMTTNFRIYWVCLKLATKKPWNYSPCRLFQI